MATCRVTAVPLGDGCTTYMHAWALGARAVTSPDNSRRPGPSLIRGVETRQGASRFAPQFRPVREGESQPPPRSTPFVDRRGDRDGGAAQRIDPYR